MSLYDEWRAWRASKWISRLNANPSESDWRKFQRWIASPGNASAYDRIAGPAAAAAAVSRMRLEAGLQPNTGPSRARPFLIGITTAAALAVAAFVLLSLGGAATSPWLTGQARAEMLPDGSLMWPSEDARYSVDFNEKERRVSLTSGSASFKIKEDAKRPFHVITPHNEILTHGGSFEIRKDSTGELVIKTSGDVDVNRTNDQSIAAGLPGLQRGGQSPGQAGSERAPAPDQTASETWIEASGMTIGEIIAKSNSQGGKPIRLADAAVASLKISGRFKMSDSSSLARKLAAAFNLNITETTEAITLSRP